ncbi:hypothetical protein PROFUN_14398 [Planoprotostelium fungivorum]|uniref:Uncharacterized protein n=1 Tax=Planoprotostelium fungivorum TaxID=1890364 RepID=A0A2P6N0C2_9EUKA|nr:hypothetical protein PROFUN_14398 [Planoprotostelium fungivorum]
MRLSLDDFEPIATIGTGTFGRVLLIRSLEDHRYYALKKLSKYTITKLKQVNHLNSEREILSQIEHPMIVKMIGTIQDEWYVYILMEFVPGGELFSLLRLSRKFPNDSARWSAVIHRTHLNSVHRFYAMEMTCIFEYLHNLGVSYRDLKPENILISSTGHIKLTDFGFAKRIALGERAYSLCGTPDYIAPEILSGKGHSTAVDWWALGILIYEMLAGYPPFYDENPLAIYKKILNAQLSFPSYFSPEARDLISQLLQTDLTKRLGNLKGGAADVKRHVWFQGIDWVRASKLQIRPPYIPSITGDDDISNFVIYEEEQEEEEFGHIDDSHFADF